MRVLLLIRNERLSELLEIALRSHLFATDKAFDSFEAIQKLGESHFDALICEHNPYTDIVLTLIGKVKEYYPKCSTMTLSECHDINEKINVIQSGADDFVELPCTTDEIVLRTKIMLRRRSSIQSPIIEAKNIRLEIDAGKCLYNDKEMRLTNKEFRLLSLLMQNKEKVLPRSTIVEQIWNGAINPFSNTVETHILNLRKKIHDSNKEKILSIPGRGYKFVG